MTDRMRCTGEHSGPRWRTATWQRWDMRPASIIGHMRHVAFFWNPRTRSDPMPPGEPDGENHQNGLTSIMLSRSETHGRNRASDPLPRSRLVDSKASVSPEKTA